MITIAIVGGTGYTGIELMRLVLQHPQTELRIITSRGQEGRLVCEIFPNLIKHPNLSYTKLDLAQIKECDCVFFATPNGVAMTMVPELLEVGVKVIDLAADFRLKDPIEWKKWYGVEHGCPDVLDEATYGLPEINREKIKTSKIVANPGCYPTAILLGLLPIIKEGWVDTDCLIADAKSGVSGAGRKASENLLLCEVSENFKAYGVAGHRHLPEIIQGLEAVSQSKIGLTFVPHLIPMIRGIHATLYAQVVDIDSDFQSLYEKYYSSEFFVDVLAAGQHPETRSVRGTNCCHIALHRPINEKTLVILSVIDNLVKGAAGQAVQNMNIMFGMKENEGLQGIAILP